MQDSESYWEDRYRHEDTPWEKGEPSPGLVDFLERRSRHIPSGSVCVPGCGTGHDVRAWARHGFEATGFDITSSGVHLAEKKTEESGLTAQFTMEDFLERPPERTFDWAFEHTFFCAIPPHLRDAYVKAMIAHIKPGGYLLAVHYLIPDMDGPPFGTTRSELLQRFSPYFSLLEEWVPRSFPNRTGLELMLWWKKTAGFDK